MGKNIILAVLKILIILVSAFWIALWILKPTQLWTRKWKGAEDLAKTTLFGSYGLNFAVSTFPIIALAILAILYLECLPKEPKIRKSTSSTPLSSPLVVTKLVGILSAMEILAIFMFITLLVWTFYTRISNDFKKLSPVKSLKLNVWQLKYLRVATRFGLLAEACLALLLLPVLRGMAMFRVFGVQFEASVRYHIWLGTSMIFFATFHGGSTLFIWGISHHIQDEIWRWQKTGRIYLAGEITLITGLVIWITSLPQIRRRKFEIFYYTHHSYIVFLIFYLFHTGDRHFYMIFPGIFLYCLDKLLRIIQSRPETCILSARVFPSKVIELTLPKDARLNYAPTSVLFMKIPSISKFQWHSFSITSSCIDENDTLSVIIKSEGWWTSSLYDMIHKKIESDNNQMTCIPVAIEGPYGPPSVDFLRHDSLVLIAGGIGITPFLSILQEIFAAQSNTKCKFPTKIQLIYVIKKSEDLFLIMPILSLFPNQNPEKLHLKLKLFVTQEHKSRTSLSELLNELLPRIETLHFSTKISSYAIHGLESLRGMAALLGFASIVLLVSLICLNHIFVPDEKRVSKNKSPSYVADIILMSSFFIAIICSGLVAIFLRWKRLRKGIEPIIPKPGKSLDESWMKSNIGALEEHQVHFGGRPNFQDIFSKFKEEIGGSDVGVLVCGPVSMKESVAALCQIKSQGLKNKPYFTFYSLNFNL